MRHTKSIEILAYLLKKGDTGATVQEIAEETGISHESVGVLKHRLVKRGLVGVQRYQRMANNPRRVSIYSVYGSLRSGTESCNSDEVRRLGQAVLLLHPNWKEKQPGDDTASPRPGDDRGDD